MVQESNQSVWVQESNRPDKNHSRYGYKNPTHGSNRPGIRITVGTGTRINQSGRLSMGTRIKQWGTRINQSGRAQYGYKNLTVRYKNQTSWPGYKNQPVRTSSVWVQESNSPGTRIKPVGRGTRIKPVGRGTRINQSGRALGIRIDLSRFSSHRIDQCAHSDDLVTKLH